MRKHISKSTQKGFKPIEKDFFERLWEESWTYIKTVVDVLREPVLILDSRFKVLIANEPFYRTFHVMPHETEGKIVYELGNGQWNIPALRKLLETILPKDTFFKGFEVSHVFPSIGRKTMILNARKIHINEDAGGKKFPPIILLAMEDITEMMAVADSMATHAKRLEDKLEIEVKRLETSITALRSELERLKS